MFIYRAQTDRRGHRGCTYYGAGYPKSQQILLFVFVLPSSFVYVCCTHFISLPFEYRTHIVVSVRVLV